MTTFDNWCLLRGVSPLPAAPADVAQFVTDCAPLGIEKVWALVQEISRLHYTRGLADPTAGGRVAFAVNAVSQIEPPHSLSKDEKLRFYALPYDMQVAFRRRLMQTEKEMKRAQAEAGDLRRKLAAKPKVKDGTTSNIAA